MICLVTHKSGENYNENTICHIYADYVAFPRLYGYKNIITENKHWPLTCVLIFGIQNCIFRRGYIFSLVNNLITECRKLPKPIGLSSR